MEAMKYAEAVKVLAAALADSKDKNVQAALEVVSAGRARNVKENPFLAMFAKVGDKVTENDAFAMFKAGRKDLYWTIADAIKLAQDKAKRKWIQFNTADETYVLMGIGAVPPENYTGYVPKAERIK